MRVFRSTGLAAIAAFGSVSSALAVPVLSLDDGVGNSITCLDGAACDSTAAAGVVTWSGSLGNWIVNVSTGVANPVLGSPTEAHMDLNSVNISIGGGGTLTIKFTQFDYEPSSATYGNSSVGGVVGAPAGSLAQFATYYDASNLGGLSTFVSGAGPFGPGAFSGTSNGAMGPIGTMFSVTQVAIVTHTGAGATSWNYEFKVAEPGSLALFGLGLLGLGAAVGRRRRRE